ncbi:heme ABC transporter ATP-binding protein [Metabacillus dongyingensis]|uniref:heme ABC transporter ATP-binding protein n=1 Tax=Metabacillus dongyingensis TaxID=2874282 RepID=UPI003B8C0E20
MDVSIKDISASIGKRKVLKEVNLNIHSGEVAGIIGPNGSGKSTLLKNMSRVIRPDAGVITLSGEYIDKMSSRKLSQHLAIVSQESPVTFDFIVREIVLMGRSPHKGFLKADTKHDEDIIDLALEKVGMKEFKQRSFSSLSGGEKQRVMIARALAQEAKVLLLDEPTNHLDVHHQIQIMDLVQKLKNITVIAALHDLNLAAYYCDRIFVMHQGEIAAYGSPEEVLTKQLLKEIFRVNADINIHPLTKKTHITFLSESLLYD